MKRREFMMGAGAVTLCPAALAAPFDFEKARTVFDGVHTPPGKVWHHFAVVRDGVDRLRAYIDGVQVHRAGRQETKFLESLTRAIERSGPGDRTAELWDTLPVPSVSIPTVFETLPA